MRRGTGVLIAAVASALVLAAETDPDTGLAKESGWEDVRAHCGTCHSFSVVTNQRATRAGWLDMIRWMQRTQNLWAIPEDSETRILDYLAANYGPQEAPERRRPPIPRELMPPRDD